MKRKDLLAEIRALKPAELTARARSLGEELMKLRFRKSSGQLEQAFRVGQAKRELARVLTELNRTQAK
jgi:ribosomal protein L29